VLLKIICLFLFFLFNKQNISIFQH
jgi:hypothetical protein